MEDTGVQEVPCRTARTLQSLSVSRLAKMLIDCAIPLSLRMYAPELHTSSMNPEPSKLENEVECECECCRQTNMSDAMIMGCCMLRDYGVDLEATHLDQSIVGVILAEAGTSTEHLLPVKQMLLEHLQKVVRWWREEGCLGGRDSRLACEVRWSCYERLRLLGTYCRYPLLLLTIELLFCPEVGHIPMIMRDMSVHHCAAYGRFLSKLQPFSVTKLYTSSLNFSCPSIIATICKLSPMLKFVHLKIEFAVGTLLREMGKVTPNLETLIILVKESEQYDSTSSTVNIVISAGPDFEDELFFGFFDGLSKKDIARKIEQGEVEDIQLSFPQLKYVDVGSHRDVREFLHYLLHLYPGLQSISCDGEGWNLSKYSLSFSAVTPSTLGSGPIALKGCKKVYNLQDMSFSSFCLASQLTVIMERYKNLEHISLHLLKGPWRIESTGQLAWDLLVSTRCRCLTVCVDVYMSRNELVSLYRPALRAVGSILTVLQFHLTNEVTSGAIRQLINMCQSLQELAIVSSIERCEVAEYDEGEEIVPLNQLPSLKCLGISSQYNVTMSLFNLIMDLLSVSPDLTTLDLEFGGRKSIEWLLGTGVAQKFTKLKRLRLSLVHCVPSMDYVKELNKHDVNTVFEPVIATAPRLTQLFIGKGCKCLLKALQERYGNSKLQIIARDQPYVAFRTLSTRCY